MLLLIWGELATKKFPKIERSVREKTNLQVRCRFLKQEKEIVFMNVQHRSNSRSNNIRLRRTLGWSFGGLLFMNGGVGVGRGVAYV
jgi:hypothetical protein